MAAAPSIEEAKLVLAGKVDRKDMSSSRHVFRSLVSGWVYKFESEGDAVWTPQPQNREEYRIYLFLRENMHLLPERTAIPEMVLLEDDEFLDGCVIASRYVEVEDEVRTCYPGFSDEDAWWCVCPSDRAECWWERMDHRATGKDTDRLLPDLWGNVFYDKEGTYWLMDLGYSSPKLERLMRTGEMVDA